MKCWVCGLLLAVLNSDGDRHSSVWTRMVSTGMNTVIIFTHADESRGSKVFICICLCVCLFVRSITHTKTKDTECSELVQGMTLGHPTSDTVLGLKGQRSRSQCHNCKKIY